jgi:hypothetical protein
MYDQTELEKWRIVESMTAVPHSNFQKVTDKAFAAEPSWGGRMLSRGELAFLA